MGALNAAGMNKLRFRLMSHFIWEMLQDRAIVTMKGQYETVPKLSNGTTFSDLERPLTQISRSGYYLTLNMSETARDTDSYNGGTYNVHTPYSRVSFRVSLSD